jgi:hypothetical protein
VDPAVETPPTAEELAALEQPDPVYSEEVELPDDSLEDELLDEVPDDTPNVDGEVITELNYLQFFQGEAGELEGFVTDIPLDDQGRLVEEAQALYAEPKPEPQAAYDPKEGDGA